MRQIERQTQLLWSKDVYSFIILFLLSWEQYSVQVSFSFRGGSCQSFNFDPNSMASALDRLLGTQYGKYDIHNLGYISISSCSIFFTGNEIEELDSDDLDDDDESDEEREEETSVDTGQNGTETLNDLRSYMDQMDEELMSTKIGQSFTVTVNVFFYST